MVIEICGVLSITMERVKNYVVMLILNEVLDQSAEASSISCEGV